jgi:hypothetical protein
MVTVGLGPLLPLDRGRCLPGRFSVPDAILIFARRIPMPEGELE